MAEATPQTAAPQAANPATPVTPGKAEEATETLKVNGKEIKLTRAQLVAAAQKGMFADQALKSVDVLKKSTEALLTNLKSPDGFLKVLQDKSLGVNPKEVFKRLMSSDVIDDEMKEEMSRWVYDRVVKPGKMTPEQIDQEKKLSDYERLKKQDEERQKSEASAKQQQEVQRVYEAVRAEVTKQIVADKTFPQTEGSVRAVVDKLRVMNRQGLPITIENVGKALDLVKKDHISHQSALLDAIEDPEKLISMFGEERALKISRALVARIQAKQKAATQEVKKEPDGREKVTDRIDKKLGRTPQGYTVLDV